MKVLDQELRTRQLSSEYLPLLRRLEFLAYTVKINKSEEAMAILKKLSVLAGEPFKDAVIYVTLRPCGACLEVFKALEIKEVYYGSEHPDERFVQVSSEVLDNAQDNQMKVKRSYFAHEGVLEPNRLFFSLCMKPGYEETCESINSWFAELINHNDKEYMSIDLIRKKRKSFQRMVSLLIGGLDKDSDLAKVNSLLIEAKRQLLVFSDFQSIVPDNAKSNIADLQKEISINQSI